MDLVPNRFGEADSPSSEYGLSDSLNAQLDRLRRPPVLPLELQFRSGEVLPEPSRSTTKRLVAGETSNRLARLGIGILAVEFKKSGEFRGSNALPIPTFHVHFIPAVDVGWSLARHFRGNGQSGEAGLAFLDHYFNLANVTEIVSFPSHPEPRSKDFTTSVGSSRNLSDDLDDLDIRRATAPVSNNSADAPCEASEDAIKVRISQVVQLTAFWT